MASRKDSLNSFIATPGLASFMSKWNKKKNPQAPRGKPLSYSDKDACLLIQRYWRMYINRSKLLLFYKRSHPANELLKTETTFVNILQCMVHVFLEPIKEQKLLEESDIRSIFSNVESILMLNKTLWIDMLERMKHWNIEQCLGDIFLKITEFFKVYIDYVKNYENALKTLTELKKNSATFRKFLKVQMRKCKGHEYESLESFLITPVQRIPRYNLLLKELVKYTKKSHPDYNDLVAALEKVQETAKYVNEKAQEAEDMAKVYDLQNTISGKFDRDLISPDRKLIREGDLIQVYGSKRKTRTIHCILFNDIIVCCKIEKLKSSSRLSMSRRNSTAGQKEYISRIQFTGAILIQTSNPPPECENIFCISNDGETIYIGSPSKSIYDEWFISVKEQIDNIAEKERFYNEQKSLVAQQRASEVRTLIQETYVRNRIKGSQEDVKALLPDQNVRKFARKKQAMSLTPKQKLDYIKEKEKTTNELLKEEKEQNDFKDAVSQQKAYSFKQAASSKYRSKQVSPRTTNNTKLRKFASLKKEIDNSQ